MIAVFAATAFIPTGAEMAVAGGTTIAAQKVLEAIFGDQAVRSLAERARADLLQRVDELLDEEADRYYGAIEAAGIDARPAPSCAGQPRREGARQSGRADEHR